jgi:hypothetical protein
MKKLLIVSCLWILTLPAHPQNASDALRYSRIFYGGTARFQGLGSAMGAVGADFSIASTNPAGLGLYKSFEMTISPSFRIGDTRSDYNGTTSSDNKVNFNLGDFGTVFPINMKKDDHSRGIMNLTFAIGVNRQNDYNNRVYINGLNNSSSMLTQFINTLNDQHVPASQIDNLYPFDIGPAYDANLIFFDSLQNRFMCDAPNGGVYQKMSITSYGSVNEFVMSFAGNFSDKLYFGATLGIPYIRYFESSTYQEIKSDTAIHYFRTLIYDQVLQTRGTGVNFKVGLIYRPANWVRIGAAIHTPTFYGNMHDSWSSAMSATFDDPTWNNTQYSPQGDYDYQLTTPFRAIGSVAFIVGPYGLISAEYEYVNYNQARFHDTNDSYGDVNQTIQDSYKAPLNLRFGTEWRIWNFRVRGGFGYYGSPYKNGLNDGKCLQASGGFGYRGRNIFADIAYVWTQTKSDYYLYDPSLVNPASLNSQTYSAVFTFGVHF